MSFVTQEGAVRARARDLEAGWRQRARDYLILVKPTICLLIVFTALAGLWLAADGPPPAGLTLATLLGAGAAAAAGGVFNHYLDRDIDGRMERTRERPIPAGRVGPLEAVALGGGLLVFSVVWLATVVNLLAALLALSGFLVYVVVYTVWLKRRTPQNIVIGGIAGAIPPLIGWAAHTGQIGVPALLLFLVVFLWTPPHFWALALLARDEYQRAGIPMLPVVRGNEETARQILLYTVLLVASSFLLAPLAEAGPLYLAVAALLGGLFLRRVLVLRRELSRRRAGETFGYSIVYLFGLCLALMVDRLI